MGRLLWARTGCVVCVGKVVGGGVFVEDLEEFLVSLLEGGVDAVGG